ncbi:hypothetical protein AYO21_05605 [Fonsecaea monophora]|uniref:NAD(P)-binding protein n=2 Tax=Fonsecaea TaxID=40354 RepID=A0A0D2GIS9_9EURO|nr:uncharacterized protein Z517_07334 [Fonsecaea pedrosoi CBS 271.37]XP_022512079.1 hypothetical protein AYO21_05605 [Fonsecaea monophora]KIW80718.1 hypothetical protein Z517_07334 [Fonsecaea pedrosoi CBS 271.37]OAG40127.1 hypothetical protein AYO21_05605 [Fonsecaea monophora]
MGSNNIRGKVIIVTGAGAGIGLAITKILLAQATVSLVVGVDVKTSELETLAVSHPDRLAVVQGDVSSRSTNVSAIDTAVRQGEKIDAVILNAAILRPVGPIADTAVEEWKRLFDVNFFGLVHAIQLSLPYLRQTNGHLLMTSSGVSLQPYHAWAAYACSKAAMNSLCAGLAKEEEQVKFLCMTPGIVDSGMQAEVRQEHKTHMPAEQYNWLTSLHANGELLRPEAPASSFARLAVSGIPKDLNGQVVAWDDERVTTVAF